MLYHQKRLAQVKPGEISRSTSHSRGPWTSRLDCFQKCTSASSRLYHPFPTIPCCAGSRPVRYVDCAVQVTAGKAGVMELTRPWRANPRNFGIRSSNGAVRPTTLRRAVRFISRNALASHQSLCVHQLSRSRGPRIRDLFPAIT